MRHLLPLFFDIIYINQRKELNMKMFELMQSFGGGAL